jgi:phosphatidate cytidylyltransferase
VAGRDPAMPVNVGEGGLSNRNLLLRIASAAVLAPLAIAVAYFGGWPFTIFWTLAAIAVWWEWVRLVDPVGSKGALATGTCTLLLETLLIGVDRVDIALLIAVLGALAAAITATREARWVAGGMIYASALLISPVIVRSDANLGFVAILFLFAVVWTTDIVAYFAGRAFGGPGLAPSISPKKTWSGAIAGTIAATAIGVVLIRYGQTSAMVPLVLVALALSIVSQLGDLFESGIKRQFDAKDASTLIPGHGGVMDRLDGFIFASCVAALFGVARAGLNTPAHGLVIW